MDEAKARYLETLEKTLERVTVSFLRVLEERQTQATLETAISTQRLRVQEIQLKIENGVLLATDRLQANLTLLENERRLLVSRTSETLAHDTLFSLLVIPKDTDFPITKNLAPLNELDLDEISADTSLERAPALRILQAQIRQTESSLSIAKSRFKPTVDLELRQYHVANGLSFLSQDRDYSEVIGQIDFPLFDGGRRRANQSRARRRLQATRLAAAATRDQITIEIGEAILGIQEGRARERSAKVRVELAEENLSIMQNRYHEGAALHTELLDADVEWRQSKLEAITSRYSILRNLAHLLGVTGQLSRVSLLGAQALDSDPIAKTTNPGATAPDR
jgi:outer membrane protein TolC